MFRLGGGVSSFVFLSGLLSVFIVCVVVVVVHIVVVVALAVVLTAYFNYSKKGGKGTEEKKY